MNIVEQDTVNDMIRNPPTEEIRLLVEHFNDVIEQTSIKSVAHRLYSELNEIQSMLCNIQSDAGYAKRRAEKMKDMLDGID